MAQDGDLRSWRRTIVAHLEDFPRQVEALETAMGTFGEDFDLAAFKRAYETRDDMEAYNRVQAVERAAGRVQNYVSELADAGSKLAGLERPSLKEAGSPAIQGIQAMRDAGVISRNLFNRLGRAQRARTMIEHSYVRTPAGDVHRAAVLVRESALEFIGRYRNWIAPHLEGGS